MKRPLALSLGLNWLYLQVVVQSNPPITRSLAKTSSLTGPLTLGSFLLFTLPLLGYAQSPVYFGQVQRPVPTANCISPAEEQIIQQQLRINRANARIEQKTTGIVLFDWPLRQRQPLDYTYFGLSFFVDQDPATESILDYNGGSRTYDGHTGTDISPQPYSWDMMDNSRVEAIAAAPGTIVLRQDGNFDRQCNPPTTAVANAVIIQHEDGSTTRYYHLKNGSVTTKAVGQTVQQGEYLGTIGSSGYAAGPHLHFEVRDANNNVIDPFAGPNNSTTASSRWLNQKAYWDSQIGRLMTHSGEPMLSPACNANPTDVTLEKRSFVSGQTVYFAKYGRDWQMGQVFNLKVIQPNGTVWVDFNYTRPYQPYAFTAYYFSQALPASAQTGVWTFQTTTLANTFKTVFNVNTTAPYASNTTLCTGSSTELVAMNGGQGFTYQWQRNGATITGATADQYTTTLAGTYRVVATLNGTAATSDPLVIGNAMGMYTLKTGSWNDPTVWSCGQLPATTDAVSVNHILAVPASFVANAQRITYGAGGKLVYATDGKLRLGF